MAHKIFIVDDHFIFRNGLKDLLTEVPDVDVIGEADSGEQFLKMFLQLIRISYLWI
jgi:DNA-binding NarL/FixJ family response regulator